MTETIYTNSWQGEPSICALFTDPIAQALMRRDGVGEEALRALMAETRRSLKQQGRLPG